jgi:hypothetical protein
MPADLGVDEAVDRARNLLDPRLAPIRELAAARAARNETWRAADEAETADAKAYAAATRAGWTESELRAVGFEAPTKRAPGRPRKSAGSRPSGQGSGGEATGQSGDGQQDPS